MEGVELPSAAFTPMALCVKAHLSGGGCLASLKANDPSRKATLPRCPGLGIVDGKAR